MLARDALSNIWEMPWRQANCDPDYDDLENSLIAALDQADKEFQHVMGFAKVGRSEDSWARNIDYLALGNTDEGWYGK